MKKKEPFYCKRCGIEILMINYYGEFCRPCTSRIGKNIAEATAKAFEDTINESQSFNILKN